MKKSKINKQKGFTLIEIMIATALFSIITTVSFSAFFLILNKQKEIQVLSQVTNNLNMVLESISRELRMGHDYNISNNNKITFTTKEGLSGIFELKEINGNGFIKRKIEGRDTNKVSLTGSNIDIKKLEFHSAGIPTGDGLQPRILIIINGKVILKNTESEFNLQTTVSQRKLAP